VNGSAVIARRLSEIAESLDAIAAELRRLTAFLEKNPDPDPDPS
jgi:hypothetical protein